MGNCLSAATPAGAVHAAEGLASRAAPPPPGKLAPAGAGALGAGAPRKRGAVGQAESSAAAADSVDNLPHVEKSAEDTAAILAAIKDNILFRDLQEPELQALLVGCMSAESCTAGTAVVTQGDRAGDTFYVIRSGACDVVVDGATVARFGPGRAFGELALLYACPRAATVRATEPTRLWVLHQRWYRLVARSAAELRIKQKAALLRKVELFARLTPPQLAKVAESLAAVEYEAGASIINKGEVGDCFYVVRSGEAVVSDGGRELARIAAGGWFGERALLKDEVRAAHITAGAGAGVACFALSRADFKAALAMVEETFRLQALQAVPQLAPLSAAQLAAAAAALEPETLPPGGELARRGTPLDGIVVVDEGALDVTDAEDGWALGATLQRGAALGGGSLVAGGGACGATLRASPAGSCTLLRLRVSAFTALFGTLEEVTAAARLAALRRVPLLSVLPPDALLALSRELEPLIFADGAAVVRQGEPGDAFYLLERGAAAVTDASGIEYARLREGAYFGELALLADDGDGVRKASVVARGGQLHVLRMTRAAFARLRQQHPAVAAGLAAGADTYAPVAFVARIGLADLSIKRALGVGTFGKVLLAHHGGKRYALKQVCKAHVVAKGLVAHVKRERDVMAECKSPFLVGLAASFQDTQHLYMMMELIMGGELFYYLQSLRSPLGEPAARFYSACVVEAFDFLHSRHYVYRDLKPENLLLTASGYIKVADFSFVKRLRAGKTYTLCGTPAYLAPEQITRAGHDRAVDWWALGVLTYEMLAGVSPFYHDDDMTMFKRIVDVKYSFLPPVTKMTYEAKDLINGLLQKAPHQRLPMGRRGVGAVREHVWFRGFAWEALREGRLKAPHVPKLRDADDMRFFADCEDENPGADYGTYTSVGNFADF